MGKRARRIRSVLKEADRRFVRETRGKGYSMEQLASIEITMQEDALCFFHLDEELLKEGKHG